MIVVVDYGMGNLRSVSKALESLGGEVQVSESPQAIEQADKVVLPGVGAFGDAARELKTRKLFKPIQKFIQSKKPFLGICLGLQLLYEGSDESPGIEGLGIFKGKIQGFKSKSVKIPHMGWNQAQLINKQHPLLKEIPDQSYFYFVHSFYASTKGSDAVLAATDYGEEQFASILGNETACATQFHPEKSQAVGLKLLKNFVEW